jgi:hypothetical protein
MSESKPQANIQIILAGEASATLTKAVDITKHTPEDAELEREDK